MAVARSAPSDRVRKAALNSAEWCAAVWRSHGLPVEQANGVWFCPHPTPQYYPNVVTVDPDAEPVEQVALIAEFARDVSLDLSVKDSFACLDLSSMGFGVLFDARWLWLTSSRPPLGRDPLDWRRIEEEQGLLAWERAWRADDLDPLRIFPPELLKERRVYVLAGFDGTETIRAGGVAYDAAGATGVTNIFGSRRRFLDALVNLSAPAEIVCYEHGPALVSAMTEGFAGLGSLRVWTRPA